jgi:hypothetical protein
VDKWVKFCEINTCKCATNREAFTFKTLWRGRDALYATGA